MAEQEQRSVNHNFARLLASRDTTMNSRENANRRPNDSLVCLSLRNEEENCIVVKTYPLENCVCTEY